MCHRHPSAEFTPPIVHSTILNPCVLVSCTVYLIRKILTTMTLFTCIGCPRRLRAFSSYDTVWGGSYPWWNAVVWKRTSEDSKYERAASLCSASCVKVSYTARICCWAPRCGAAAGGRLAPPLSIDISRPPGPQQQTRRSGVRRQNDGANRQTTDERPSVNNSCM